MTGKYQVLSILNVMFLISHKKEIMIDMQWILLDIPIGRNIKASDLKALKTIFDVEYEEFFQE